MIRAFFNYRLIIIFLQRKSFMPIFFGKYSSPPFILPFKSVLFKPSLILTHVFYYINDEVLTTVVVETDDLLFSVYFIERNKNLMMC